MVFINMKQLVHLFFLFLLGIALFVFYKTFGLSMLFLLAVGLLALKFFPVMVLPILLIAIGVHFSGDFSFIADGIVGGFWIIVSLPICFAFVNNLNISVRKKRETQEKDI